jgi:hypothetical protein
MSERRANRAHAYCLRSPWPPVGDLLRRFLWMIAGEAPHLETFFLSYRYGRPKDQDQLPHPAADPVHQPVRPPEHLRPLGPPGGAPRQATMIATGRTTGGGDRPPAARPVIG